MTPSGWHDDARNRDAGHDEMQVAVWKYINKRRWETFELWKHEYRISRIDFERAFISDGAIVGFADVCEEFVHNPAQGMRYLFLRIWEIKPKIYSVGAIVRQCQAIRILLRNWKEDKRSHTSPSVRLVTVIPVCKPDDPKLSLLIEVENESVACWNGERLTFPKLVDGVVTGAI